MIRHVLAQFPVVALAGLLAAVSAPAMAFIGGDDEARKAILQVRERVDDNSQAIASTQQNMLAMDSRIVQLSEQLALAVGHVEILSNDVRNLRGDLEHHQARLRALEPILVEVDGQEFMAEPREIKAYDEALLLFQAGDYALARKALETFLQSYPMSGYKVSVKFWLGNSFYALQECKQGLEVYEAVVSERKHLRAPDAMLGMANCYAELRNNKSAKAILQRLIERYPESAAAGTAAERLP